MVLVLRQTLDKNRYITSLKISGGIAELTVLDSYAGLARFLCVLLGNSLKSRRRVWGKERMGMVGHNPAQALFPLDLAEIFYKVTY